MSSATFATGSGDVPTPPRWLALDEPGEWESFGRPLPSQAGRWESYLAIQGMHCAACALTVEALLQQLPGVHSVQVNGASAVARLAWSPALGLPSAWWAALQRAGYGALPAGDVLATAPRIQAQRLLLLLVAGFCMMQVMMYAYATAIFRIAQESLANVAKHAEASAVTVALERVPGAILLAVSDNGRGFAVGTPRKPQSLGLMGLRERVLLLQGSLSITSTPGQGTRIEVSIPLPDRQVLP